MYTPTKQHWDMVKHILQFINGTILDDLCLYHNSSRDFNIYSDIDWTGSSEDQRSTSRFVIFLDKNLISWSSKKATNCVLA